MSYLILCMLHRKPQSGYAVCQNIEAMPIGAISSSPGSIYPCLKNLEDAGLLLSKVVGGSVKPRKHFRISTRGKRVLSKWFDEAIDATAVIKSPETLFIKLSYFDTDSSALSDVLLELEKDLINRKKLLLNYKAGAAGKMNQGGLLALDLSIQMTDFLKKWTGKAAKEISSVKL